MWLDNVIGYFSPSEGLKRVRARKAFEVVRSYEGAKTGRRTDGWNALSTSANQEISAAGFKLRERARDLIRNNPYAEKAVDVYVSNAVGTGIIPQAKTGSSSLNQKIMDAWERWQKECDADGQLDFYGIQALVAEAQYESGECFIRFRDRFAKDGLSIPFQLQVLEADFLDTGRTGIITETGGYINQGIEFDSIGRRVAYWMFSNHPGDMLTLRGNLLSSRIPAEQIIHIYRKRRPGQIRGVTEFASVILKMRDIDDYDEAELIRKKIESCFAAFVTQNDGSDGPALGSASITEPETGTRVESFRPGMIGYLKPGEDVKFGTPSGGASNEEYSRRVLHAVSSGLKITYEQLTGDLSQVNYSSLRAGLLEFRRMVERRRWQMLIPMLCDAVWQRFIDRAYLAGLIRKQDYGVEWSPPKFEMIDPLKDAQADTIMMRNGTMTLKEAIASRGNDPERQIETIAETNNQLDAKGIVLDSDPRKTAKSGIIHNTGEIKNEGT